MSRFCRNFTFFLFALVLPYSLFGQTAQFTTNTSSGCNYLIVQFNATGSGGTSPLKYHWDFGNGNSIERTNQNASAIYNSPGTYLATLRVEDVNGNMSDPFSRTIIVHDGPTADFTISGNTNGCAPLPIVLNDVSSQGSSAITNWFWEFGDGNTSNMQNPEKTYTTTGNFTINLRVTDQNGCIGNKELREVVTTTDEIRFRIEGNPTYSCDTSKILTTSFDPGLPYNADLSKYNFFWDFGNGNNSNEVSPTTSFSTGSYDIMLRVSTTDGVCSVEQTFPSFINVGEVNPTISYWGTYPVCGVPRYTFQLDNFGVADNQKIIWDFGDGETDTVTGQARLNHTYDTPGSYNVKATITDPADPTCINIVETTSDIVFPDHSFTSDIQYHCNLVPIAFNPPNLWNARSYIWQFGDGTSSYERYPVKTYSEPGTYDVTLTIIIGQEDACLLTIKQEDFIHIGNPEASFSTNGREVLYDMPVGYDLSGLPTTHLEGGCLSDVVNFNAAVKGDIETYKWIFGDGTTETTTSPEASHYYSSNGEFSPMLVVVDKQGCIDTVRCDNCVRRGEKNSNADVTLYSDGNIINNVNDTICCFYNFLFENETNPDEVDLIWYHLELIGEQGGLPPAYSGFYKEEGKFYSYEGAETDSDLLDMMYVLASFSIPILGDDPNLHYYTYDNGCQTIVDYPKFVHHRLPWGNFLYTPPECEPNADPNADTVFFDLNDPVTFQGDWLAEENYPLDSVVIGIPIPGYGAYTYRRSDYGILNLQQLQQVGAFPVIKIPTASAPPMFMVTTTLYDSDPLDPNGFIKPPAILAKCGPPGAACFDQVPIPILFSGLTVNIETLSSVKQGCAPLTVDFQLKDPSVVNIDSSLTWNFSDGQKAHGSNPTVTFPIPDTITYFMTGYDSSGCFIDTVHINDTIIVTGINVSFSIDGNAICLNEDTLSDIKIVNSSYSTASISENKWDFAGYKDTIINHATFDYKFSADTSPPLHLQFVPRYISLTVTDDIGCTGKDSLEVYIRKPEANVNFALRDNGSCSPGAWMNLSNYEFVGGFPPIYGELYWKWDTATEYNIKDIFSAHGTEIWSKGQEGKVNVFLKITGDSMGVCPATSNDTTFEFMVSQIEAHFSISDTSFECAPAMVTFSDTNTILINDSIPIEAWNWVLYNEHGEVERTSELKEPEFQLATSGYYRLELEVVDENDCIGTIEQDSVLLIKNLTAAIILPKDTICMGESLEYRGDASKANFYNWDFGDGQVYFGETVTHAFQQHGQRVVRLIVHYTGDSTIFCEDHFQDSIYVQSAPVLNIDDALICIGDTARLQAPELAEYNYLWKPTGATASYIIVNKPDTFYLQVTDIRDGCVSYDTILVDTISLPEIRIEAPNYVCISDEISVTATSNPEASYYEWRNATGTYSYESSHLLKIDSTIVVELIIIDTNKCKNSIKDTIFAVEQPVINLPDTSSCEGDSVFISAVPINLSYPMEIFSWTRDGEKIGDTTNTISINEQGKYIVKLNVGVCQTYDTFFFHLHPNPDISLNEEEYVYCEEFGGIELDAGEAVKYWWYHSGEKSRKVYVSSQDTFVVRLTNIFNCFSDDEIITINRCQPRVYHPNAFIPGKDGDDQFYINTFNLGYFHLIIFNRWGEVIFETNDPKVSWDGTYRGEPMPAGVYPWLMKYKGDNPDYDKILEKKGMVTIIR